ncbi:hypothetical protein E3J49_01035 [Candidatus Bathyarchaeota archaeon]|nr:MAG: hypothetical protein E3J49_01035 [Candidatus Bathyarchaeota archaeon]
MNMLEAVDNDLNIPLERHMAQRMHVAKIANHIDVVDLELAGIKKSIANHTLKRKNSVLV